MGILLRLATKTIPLSFSRTGSFGACFFLVTVSWDNRQNEKLAHFLGLQEGHKLHPCISPYMKLQGRFDTVKDTVSFQIFPVGDISRIRRNGWCATHAHYTRNDSWVWFRALHGMCLSRWGDTISENSDRLKGSEPGIPKRVWLVTHNTRVYDINQRFDISFKNLFLIRVFIIAARETS